MFGRLAKFRSGGDREAADDKVDDSEVTEEVQPSDGVEVEYDEQQQSTAEKFSGPLYKFDDGYNYPNLFQEADEMLLVAMLMYAFTDLRTMARQGKLSDRSILNLPITLETALKTIEDNLVSIQAEEAGHEMALAALQSIQNRYDQSSGKNAADESSPSSTWLNPFYLVRKNHKNLEPATLTAFGDTNAEKELVYAVGIDHFRKRITVAFRGSVTPNDFITDASIDFNRRDNPVAAMDEGQPETIGLHHGFDEYLLKRRKAGVGECKYDEIMKHVRELFVGRTDSYKLYVTGHSLGGALACLFAFEAAALNAVPTPVTCVSVASPRVGDSNFQTAFMALEQTGRLRHLRVAHSQDPVTMMPKASSKKTLAMLSPIMFVSLAMKDALFASSETYRHTGVKLQLLTNKSKAFELSYKGVTTVQEEIAEDGEEKKPTPKRGLLGSFQKISFSGIPGVKFHYCSTYSEQLALCQKELSGKSLNAVYAEMGER